MNLRVVVAVALATALLGASMPVVEDARVAQGDARVAGALDRVERAATELRARNDALADREAAATRELTLHLPSGTWGTAGLARLDLDSTDGPGSRVTWRVRGGSDHVRHLTGVTLAPDEGANRRLTGGRVTVRLELVRRDGHRRVLLAVPDFTTDRATSRGHVRTAIDRG